MPDGEQVVPTSKSNENFFSHCIKYLVTLTKMSMRKMSGEIFILIILFVFTSYASLQKGALKVQMQPAPEPFFESNSTVKDFYWGEVTTPFLSVINSDVSLILYYATWDLDSQLTRIEFDASAKQFEGQVYFTAINCWVNNGACKQTFPKLRTFPIILGYVGGNKGVQYRGPLQHQYLNKFVQHLLKPLKRIETISDLYTLKARSSAVVTGYFNFSNSSTKPVGFFPFYVASLRYFEYDPHKSVDFALITNSKAANQLGIHLASNQFDLRLHLWNETLIFPNNGSLDVNRFLQWVYFRSHSPITWVWPSNRKSQVIQHYFADQQRPSFVLFTPRLQESSQAMVVREVALDYNNCVSSHRISRLVQEIKHQRELLEVTRLALENKCSIFGGEKYCITNYNTSIPKDSVFSVEEMCLPSSRPSSSILNPIQGLGCRTNRSLNFFLMDSKQYPHFLHSLGYSANQLRLNANIALIVDPKEESHFILNRPMTRENVEQFITNYTVGGLRRFRRSLPVVNNTPKRSTTGQVYVVEISGNDFEKVVLDPAYDVVVFYRKSGCVFCDACNRHFLQVSQMFSPSKGFNWKGNRLNEIKFVTIDTDTNDVPWQFTVDKYPTFIFYPANRKMDSRVFPLGVEVNVANLLNFTLSQLSIKKRLAWFLHSCFQSNDHIMCLQEAQHQISAQKVIIDQQIRRLHYRLLWSESNSTMRQLRRWLKERFFYKELSYAILNYIANQRRVNHQSYPEGFSLSN